MCGITAYYHKTGDWKLAKERCLDLLAENKSRGTDSFGVLVSLPGKKSFLRLRATEIERVKEWKEWEKVVPGSFILVHNRTATSTLIHWTMAHPFINEDKTVGMVHNGMIHSYMEEYDRLQKLGHVFETFHEICESMWVPATDKSYETPGKPNINDSEVLLHEYEEKKGVLEDVKNLYRLGSVAIGIVDLTKDVMIVGRDSNPLVTNEYGDGSLAWTSQHAGKKWFETNDEFVVTVGRDGKITIIEDGRKPYKYDWEESRYAGGYGGHRSKKTGGITGAVSRYFGKHGELIQLNRDNLKDRVTGEVRTESGIVLTGTESPEELARLTREEIEREKEMERNGDVDNEWAGMNVKGISPRERTLRFLSSLPPGVETASGTCEMCGLDGVVYEDPYGFGFPACQECYSEMQYTTLDRTMPVIDDDYDDELESDESVVKEREERASGATSQGKKRSGQHVDADGVGTTCQSLEDVARTHDDKMLREECGMNVPLRGDRSDYYDRYYC